MRKLLPALAVIVALTALTLVVLALNHPNEVASKNANTRKNNSNSNTNGPARNRNAKNDDKNKGLGDEVISPPSLNEDRATNSNNPNANIGGTTSPTNNSGPESPSSSLFEPIVLGIVAMLLLAGFALHGISFINTKRLQTEVGQISQNFVALRNRVEDLSGQMTDIRRSRNPWSKAADRENSDPDKLRALEDRIRETRSLIADTSQAIATLANWAGESAIERAVGSADELSDAERNRAINLIERHLDSVSSTASRLRPLAQEIDAFEERVKQRVWLPAEMKNRLQNLSQEISQFEKWKTVALARLDSLRRGSISERQRKFIEEKNRLAGNLNNGQIPAIDYVKGCRQLAKELFSQAAEGKRIPTAEIEEKLSSLASGSHDMLMNWYDDLFQLTQVAASQSSMDSDTVEELARIRRMAKDALLKFDIQPEEIQPGRTNFDHRLHEAAAVAQSSQFPANTVIGVQQCGFRRASNGEVLRRPKVVVARVGAG